MLIITVIMIIVIIMEIFVARQQQSTQRAVQKLRTNKIMNQKGQHNTSDEIRNNDKNALEQMFLMRML